MGNTNEHISTNIHPLKSIKFFMEKLYPYSIKIGENIVVILYIYGARAIFLLFRFMTKTLNLSNGKYKRTNIK